MKPRNFNIGDEVETVPFGRTPEVRGYARGRVISFYEQGGEWVYRVANEFRTCPKGLTQAEFPTEAWWESQLQSTKPRPVMDELDWSLEEIEAAQEAYERVK